MLKENEYIRTDLGNILKYTGKEKEFIDKHLSISNKKDIEFLGTIVKHSKNIIDLIEVGDYYKTEMILNNEVEIIEENKGIEELPNELINDDWTYYTIKFYKKINELVRAVNKLNKERECE